MTTACRLFVPFCAALITACAPSPIYRLHPIADDTLWLHGQQVARRVESNLEARVSFARSEGDQLVFDMEITNLADGELLVSPEKFHCFALPTRKDSSDWRLQQIFAFDPEEELLQIDKAIAREKTSHATESAVDATVSLLAVVVYLATIGQSDTEAEIEERAEVCDEIAASRQESEKKYYNQMAHLQHERQDWEFDRLRKTTLQSGQTVGGKVYFAAPSHEQTRFLKLVLPFGEKNMEFLFELKRIN
jgi:hypothetical protein